MIVFQPKMAPKKGIFAAPPRLHRLHLLAQRLGARWLAGRRDLRPLGDGAALPALRFLCLELLPALGLPQLLGRRLAIRRLLLLPRVPALASQPVLCTQRTQQQQRRVRQRDPRHRRGARQMGRWGRTSAQPCGASPRSWRCARPPPPRDQPPPWRAASPQPRPPPPPPAPWPAASAPASAGRLRPHPGRPSPVCACDTRSAAVAASR